MCKDPMNPNLPHWRKCSHCGKSMEEAPKADEPEEPTVRSMIKYIIIGMVMVCAPLGLLIMYLKLH